MNDELSDEAKALVAQADAAIPDAPTIEPGDEPEYAVGEVSPEGEVRTVRIYGRDVPVGLLTELADPKCPNCWSSHGTGLQGSYVATRMEKGQPVRQRQLCECTVRRYVKKNPKEAPQPEAVVAGPRVTRTDTRLWAEQAVRLKRKIDGLGTHLATLEAGGANAESIREDLVKLRRRYERALGRAGLA